MYLVYLYFTELYTKVTDLIFIYLVDLSKAINPVRATKKSRFARMNVFVGPSTAVERNSVSAWIAKNLRRPANTFTISP